jgi:hypothetical protein
MSNEQVIHFHPSHSKVDKAEGRPQGRLEKLGLF